ncbi:hypothetical protein OG292_07470 [Streptomyces sp. NBC_01511]|uniref:hypothetical protein n=1 Tax=Streptomyces sp. NBC_01511 TaxID=2903889 RepID=UPI003868E9ED
MTDSTGPVRDASPSVPTSPTPTTPPAEPTIGDTVHDTARDRVGIVMAHQGPCLQLRPLGGGREWDADPAHVRPPSPAELLSAQLAEVNARSRQQI